MSYLFTCQRVGWVILSAMCYVIVFVWYSIFQVLAANFIALSLYLGYIFYYVQCLPALKTNWIRKSRFCFKFLVITFYCVIR